MALDSVIRSEGSKNFKPQPVPPRKNPIEDLEGFVTWGSSGNSLFETSAEAKGAQRTSNEETVRRYDVVRVKNPDDDDQYVEQEVMTDYQARNRIDGSRTRLRFQPQKESKTVEIKERGKIRRKGE